MNEASDRVELSGERWFEAEVHRVKGEAYLHPSRREEARAADCFKKAQQIASLQGARLWELRAVLDLSQLGGSQACTNASRSNIAALYGAFTEGLDTADLRRAKALLDKLS